MKRVRVNSGKVALVFRKGELKRILDKGLYWIFPSEKAIQYDLSQAFIAPGDLNVLLRNKDLENHLYVVEIKDYEITLVYEKGIFKRVLTSGTYAYWKGLIDYSFVKADLSKIEITENIDRNTLLRQEMSGFVREITVEPYQKALLYIDGVYDKILVAGTYLFWKNSVKINVAKTDIRQLQLEISGQEILTKDKAALRVNFFAQYKVVDIVKALNENKEYEKQLYILMQLALREFVGTLTLDEILEKKESISEYVLNALKTKADKLGVEIQDSGVRDIILPGEMKEIMNQVLIAQKQAQANIITRREETASTRSLLNTAKLMEENEMLFRLKEMEYVEKIAEKINTISLSGGNQIIDQLKDIFISKKQIN